MKVSVKFDKNFYDICRKLLWDLKKYYVAYDESFCEIWQKFSSDITKIPEICDKNFWVIFLQKILEKLQNLLDNFTKISGKFDKNSYDIWQKFLWN